MTPHPLEAARDTTLEALVQVAQADPRLSALRLQGSLAGEVGAGPDVKRPRHRWRWRGRQVA